MGVRFGFRWQIVLVVALFVASLAVLLSSSLTAIWMPARQVETQKRLIDASRRMAEEAAPLLKELPDPPRKPPHDLLAPAPIPPPWRDRLTAITHRALLDYPGVEGGFYLAGDWRDFTGHDFPNDPHAPPEPPPPPGKKHHPKGKGPHPKGKGLAHDPLPPPKEREFILAQCQASLTAEPDAPPIVQITEIPPSRVLVVTEPVGRQRPALMTTWVMTRLSSPEQMAADLHRNQAATVLALAGIVAALVLTTTLGRNLRLTQRQREQLREELRRAEHLAALGKLLAGVAHEVRNPLAAIRSTAQLWQRLPPESRDPSAMDVIVRGVDRLNALVSRLLFFVRTGHEERRPVDVNAVVQEALTLQRAQADSQHVALQTELADNLPPLSGSVQALQQVVLNLTTNALQAMPNGGTLLCRTRRLESPARIELWIADTGPGIAATELPHLFEPFHTTRPEGTGLGLALCREIVQQHGGRIELDRQEGWGAVFRVTLPL